ncbi:MAG: sigma factor [Caldilineaceae bacterium]
MDQQQIFRRLEQANWDELSRKVLARAIWVAQNKRWHGRQGNVDATTELVGGVSCEDVVQELIVKTIRGERKWDPDKVELEPWLYSQVRSLVSHLIESAEHAHASIYTDEEIESQPNAAVVGSPSARLARSSEVTVLRTMDDAAAVAAIYDATADDPQLEELVTATLDGCEPKPQALAEELGTNVQDINNRLKRLRRRAVVPRT